MLAVAVLAQGIFLGRIANTLYFLWGDDDDFLLERGTVTGVDKGWWAPHDDHWSTGTILIYRALFAVFGLRTYLPYGLVPILMHLALGVVLYLLLVRLGTARWQALGPALIVVTLGAGGGAILWSVTMGSIGAVLLGFLAVYVAAGRDTVDSALRPMWILLVIALTLSGVGITAVAFATAFATFRWGWRAGARVMSVPLVIFVVWFVFFGWGGVKEKLDTWAYADVPDMLAEAMTTHLQRLFVFPGSGLVALLVLVGVVLFVRETPWPLRQLGLAGVLTAFFQITLAGITRPSFGISNFELSRYGYFTCVFLAPAMAILIGLIWPRIAQPRWVAAVLAVWLLAAIMINGQRLFHQEQSTRELISGQNPGLLKGIRKAAQQGQPVLTQAGYDFLTFRFRADLIAREEMWSKLPAGEPTEQDLVNAEGWYFVGVDQEQQLPVEMAPRLEFGDGWSRDTRLKKGCATYKALGDKPELALAAYGAGAQTGILGPTAKMTTVLERDGVVGPSRDWEVDPRTTTFVGTSAHEATLRVTLHAPGDYYICT
jgi:hypothetical protein